MRSLVEPVSAISNFVNEIRDATPAETSSNTATLDGIMLCAAAGAAFAYAMMKCEEDPKKGLDLVTNLTSPQKHLQQQMCMSTAEQRCQCSSQIMEIMPSNLCISISYHSQSTPSHHNTARHPRSKSSLRL